MLYHFIFLPPSYCVIALMDSEFGDARYEYLILTWDVISSHFLCNLSKKKVACQYDFTFFFFYFPWTSDGWSRT